jgi:hypothetical protein
MWAVTNWRVFKTNKGTRLILYESWRFLRLRSPARSHFPKSKLVGVMSIWYMQATNAGSALKYGHGCPFAVVGLREHEGPWTVKDLQNMM